MALILTDEQKVSLSVSFVTAAGNPATVDGAPVWSSSDESVVTVTPSGDGFSCTATTVGPLGAAQVSCTADADLGSGVRSVSATLDIEVHAAEAVAANISASAPEPK